MNDYSALMNYPLPAQKSGKQDYSALMNYPIPSPPPPPPPGIGTRMAQGAASIDVPGYQSAKAIMNPQATLSDKAGAVAGDIGTAAATYGIPAAAAAETGGASLIPALARSLGAGAVMGAAGGALQPVAQKASDIGGAVGQAIGNVTGDKIVPGTEGNTLVQFQHAVPRAIGEILGQAIPQALIGLLTGKVSQLAGSERPGQPLTDAEQSAKDLQDHGYPVTRSHVDPTDTALKQASTNAKIAPQFDAYKQSLAQAGNADVAKALNTGVNNPQATAILGDQAGKSYNAALKTRSDNYGAMISAADNTNPEGVNTGIGEFTHVGQQVAKKIYADLSARGVNIPDAKIKVLTGSGLTPYDVPSDLTPQEATAAIKFADVVQQKEPSVVGVANRATQFANDQDLFPNGGGSSKFLRDMRNHAVNTAGEILQQRDAAAGPAQTPVFPQWQQQRSNWHQTAGLADEMQGVFGKEGQPYDPQNVDPEKIFTSQMLQGGTGKINAFKDFLSRHGQDPGIVDKMGRDWLLDQGQSKAGSNTAPFAMTDSIATKWQTLSPELKSAIFDPSTIDDVNQAIARTKAAKAPLEVMGTKASGESPTQSRLALAGQATKAAAVPIAGAATGAALAHMLGFNPLEGGGIGYVSGEAVKGVGTVLKNNRDLSTITKPPVIAPTPPRGALVPGAQGITPQLLLQALGGH